MKEEKVYSTKIEKVGNKGDFSFSLFFFFLFFCLFSNLFSSTVYSNLLVNNAYSVKLCYVDIGLPLNIVHTSITILNSGE